MQETTFVVDWALGSGAEALDEQRPSGSPADGAAGAHPLVVDLGLGGPLASAGPALVLSSYVG